MQGMVYYFYISNYYIVVENNKESRVVLYINKCYTLGDQTSETRRDQCSMMFQEVGNQELVIVVLVYIEQQQHRGIAQSTSIHAFQLETRQEEIVLVENFNLKHLLQNQLERIEVDSNVLLDLVQRDEMECAVEVHDCRDGVGVLGLEKDSRELEGRTRRNKHITNKQIGPWLCSGIGQSIVQCAVHTLLQ